MQCTKSIENYPYRSGIHAVMKMTQRAERQEVLAFISISGFFFRPAWPSISRKGDIADNETQSEYDLHYFV